MIDLDANATTALDPQVLDAMLPWLSDHHGNPSGTYRAAKKARSAIDRAREQLAALLKAHPDEIVFTGSGTESVNACLHSLLELTTEGVVVTSAVEHSAVLGFLKSRDCKAERVGVCEGGVLQMDAFERVCESGRFASVMMANNEVGTIQPVEEIIRVGHAHGIPVHTDAVQAAGKLAIDVGKLEVDLLSISAHKFHGPKGIGAIYLRNGVEFRPLIVGGGQERGRRSGTENTAAIVAMGEAAELARILLEEGVSRRMENMRDEFETLVLKTVEGAVLNGALGKRLPNTSHISFSGCDAAGMLILLDGMGLACSAGSACMTGQQKPSHVQMAMGISPEVAKTSLRFSFSRMNKESDAAEAADIVARAVEKLRSVQGFGVGPVAVYTS